MKSLQVIDHRNSNTNKNTTQSKALLKGNNFPKLLPIVTWYLLRLLPLVTDYVKMYKFSRINKIYTSCKVNMNLQLKTSKTYSKRDAWMLKLPRLDLPCSWKNRVNISLQPSIFHLQGSSESKTYIWIR